MDIGGNHPVMVESTKIMEFGESEPKKPKLDDGVALDADAGAGNEFDVEMEPTSASVVASSSSLSGQVEESPASSGYHKIRPRENSGERESATSDSGISNSNEYSASSSSMPGPSPSPGPSQLKSILKPAKAMTKRRRKYAVDPKTGESKIVKSSQASGSGAGASGEDFGTYIDYRGVDETEYYDEDESDKSECGDYGDDDDENDENNWRNEYPDEDKGHLHFWEDEEKDVCRLRSLQVGTGDDLSSDDDEDGLYDEPLYTLTGGDEEGDGASFNKIYSKYKARVSKQLGVSMNISNEVVSSPSESDNE